jgi:hypothetical protein
MARPKKVKSEVVEASEAVEAAEAAPSAQPEDSIFVEDSQEEASPASEQGEVGPDTSEAKGPKGIHVGHHPITGVPVYR